MLRESTTAAVALVIFSVTSSRAFGQASFRAIDEGPYQSCATAVSADGTTVVGSVDVPGGGSKAFRWTEADGLQVLGDLPGNLNNSASSVSGNGAVVVGDASYMGAMSHAFRWTAATGMTALPDAMSTNMGSFAPDVSDDGLVVVGFGVEMYWCGGAIGRQGCGWDCHANADGSVLVLRTGVAVRWTCESIGHVTYQGLATTGSYPTDVSPDGNAVVGAPAFLWTAAEGVRYLGSGEARGVSADGKVVVGYELGAGEGGRPAPFIWDADNGRRALKEVLENDYCLDLTGWNLTIASGISDDGLTLVGCGSDPDHFARAWIARLAVTPRIVESDPPTGAIDARADFSNSGTTRRGIDRFRIRFGGRVRDPVTQGTLTPSSFDISSSGSSVPSILAVNPVEGAVNTFDVVLDDPIEAGEWTTLMPHVERADGRDLPPLSCDGVVVGFLPADANGNRTSGPVDILHLIDHLNGVFQPPMKVWQCDIDRSGVCGPADILRLIDLLNGANTSRPWNGVRLPPRP